MGTTPQSKDPEIMAVLLRRSPLLEELQGGEVERRALQERLELSRATIYRHSRQLIDLGLIEKADGEYRLTESGDLVADAIDRFKREAGSALQLAPVLEGLEDKQVDMPLDAFAGATVTSAGEDDPYAPVNRFESLLERTNELRFVGSEIALMEPCLDNVQQLIRDGVDVRFIDRPSCTAYFFSEYPELSLESLERENFTVLEHDGLPPYGIGLFSDRVAISWYEQDIGTVRALIDTDAPEAREWAETKFASFSDAAELITPEPIVE